MPFTLATWNINSVRLRAGVVEKLGVRRLPAHMPESASGGPASIEPRQSGLRGSNRPCGLHRAHAIAIVGPAIARSGQRQGEAPCSTGLEEA